MIDLTYTDPGGVEQGIVEAYQLDLAYGDDENDFELVLPIDMRIAEKSRIYIDGTEWGGIVRGGRESTVGSAPVYVATGETWHGKLASTYICPASAYLDVAGDAHAAMRDVVAFAGLADMFDVPGNASGITVKHRFDRFTDVYSGFRKMLAASGGKLKITKNPGSKPTLVAVPVGDYVDGDEGSRYGYEIAWDTPINHLICLGMGELEKRTVLHLYADADGKVSQTQTLFGLDERQLTYDYNNVEDDKLLEEGKKKLEELQAVRSCELILPEGAAFDVGDVVGIASELTGASVTSTVSKVIVKVSGDGQVEVTNEIGEISASRHSAGATSGGAGGIVYKAGGGISIAGATISAEVTKRDLDGKAAKSHAHNWDAITGKPQAFTPAEHAHGWDSVTGKPDTFAPGEHDHDGRYYTEAEMDSKLSGKSDTDHAHGWGEIGGKPATYPPSDHAHGWAEVSDKPATYPPIDHAHGWAAIEDKPESFTPSEHAHAAATKDADGFLSAADKAVIDSLSGGSVTGVKGSAESAYRTGNVSLSAANIGAAPSGHGHDYLPLSGGAMRDAAQMSRAGRSMSWFNGRDGAMVRQTTYTGYNPIFSVKSTYATWELGPYTGDTLYLSCIADSDYSANRNVKAAEFSFASNGTFSTAGLAVGGKSLLDRTYPVGSYYFADNPTSPAARFGGTWQQIVGRFVRMANDTATGGSDTHTLSANEMPKHRHIAAYYAAKAGWSGTSPNGFWTDANNGYVHYTNPTTLDAGGSAAHNNMPAFQDVYAWKRTA